MLFEYTCLVPINEHKAFLVLVPDLESAFLVTRVQSARFFGAFNTMFGRYVLTVIQNRSASATR